ncbi:hypothetical protein JC525_09420 [Alteromonas sp. IB21]|nr:Ada metal-binding domain-containing protein [Alteromonas sp. IB21]MBJ2129157.1 hypothetical protein [Alteromonas sp. IB21]
MADSAASITSLLDESVFSKARLSRDPRFDGRFFVAVKTTGIFCRPICPARLPLEENVTYYQYATQARKEAVRHFAGLFLDGNNPSHEAILAIKGVGHWTLDYLKMRGERNPDIYLNGDLIVRKMAAQYPIEPDKAAPWRSYLTLQLWQLSNQQKEL